MIFNMTAVFAFAESTENNVSDICYQIYSGFYDGGLVANSLGGANKKLLMSNIATRALTDPTWASIKESCDILSTAGTSAWSGYGILYKYCRSTLRTPSECDVYMKSQYSFDDQNDTYSIGSSVQSALNDEISDISYIEATIPSIRYINPDGFSDSRYYWAIINLVQSNSDYVFNLRGDYFGNGNYFLVASKLQPYGAVVPKNKWGLDYMTDSALYNEYWTQNFTQVFGDYFFLELTLNVQNTNGIILTGYNFGNQEEPSKVLYDGSAGNLKYDLDNFYNPEQRQSYFSNSNFPVSGVLYNSSADLDYYYSTQQGVTSTWWKDVNTSVPVFSSLSALKKGTVGKTPGDGLTSNFTGTALPSVSVSQVQNATPVINNYMTSSDPNNGGGNNNNNNSDDDDEGGSSILDIIKKIGSIVTTIVDSLLTIVDRLVETFGTFISTITGFFDDLSDIADNGVSNLFSSFFPYLPESWFKVVGFLIGLALFSLVIKIFLK